MAYKRETLKIVPGGLNLLAPVDQVADGDSLDLTGFWPAAAGKLQQAPGYEYLSKVHLDRVIDGLCETSGRVYYSGRDLGATTGDLFQVGRAGEAAIDSGYDGYPLGLLGYQGYAWVMNRAKQRRDNGTTVSDWTPAPPGLPTLTNPGLASSALTITELDPANPDATTGDYTMIRMWTSSSIAGLEVGALMTISGAGAYNGTWQVTDIFDGSPTSLIQMAAKIPAGTAYSVAGGMTATFANPSMPMGDYEYWVTWAYTDLGESNPSTSAGVITAATRNVPALGTKIHVDISALSPPSGAAYWNVYRKGPGMPSAYRVNLDPIPIATTSYDDFGDAAHSQDNSYLIDTLGILMEGDHDPAPAARIIANQVYNGRILVANSAAYPNRIWYTPPLQPGFFRGSGNPQAGDWVDVGTDRGDEILYMAVKPGQVTIYRAKSIWRHIGDFGDPNARLEVSVPDLGVVGPRAAVSTSLGDYFRGPEGIYKYNGDWAQKISPKLDPLFRGLDTDNFIGETAAHRANCALGFYGGRLWVSYTGGSVAFNNQCVVYHVDTDRWFSRTGACNAYLDRGTVLSGGTLFYALNLETGYQDGIGGTVLSYQSAYLDCGLPDHEKTWGDLVIHHNTLGETVTIGVRTNKGATTNDVFDLETTISSGDLTKTVVPLVYPITYPVVELRREPIQSFNLSVRLTATGASTAPGIVIESPLILHYYVEARAGKTFDSGPTDHGTPDVKVLDQIEVDIDADANCDLLIRGDLPGGAIANQLTQTIPATQGRQIRRLVLSNAGSPFPVDARLFRQIFTSPSDFHVYGLRVRVLPIGVYLDGSVGDYWVSNPITVGT